MRHAVTILIVVFAAAGLFTLYGLLTFTPDQSAPFVFEEPKLPGTVEGSVLIGSTGDDKNLTPEQKEQRAAALQQVESSLTAYQNYEKFAPSQAVTMIGFLRQMVLEGRLPSQFLSPKGVSSVRGFEVLRLSPSNYAVVEPDSAAMHASLTCLSKTPPLSTLVGNERDNKLTCDLSSLDAALRPSDDRIFLGGPGNDTIEDTAGNRLVNGGSGDDTISLGNGRTIIVLDAGWGKDTLKIDCTGAEVLPTEIPEGSAIPWNFKYSNFIVLGPGLKAADVSWKENVLSSSSGEDTLIVNENCFNLVDLK